MASSIPTHGHTRLEARHRSKHRRTFSETRRASEPKGLFKSRNGKAPAAAEQAKKTLSQELET